MAEQQDASLMSLPDELILLVMEKAAVVSGTMAVLRGLASARRRFQQLAYGDASKLFTEPVFVGGNTGARPGVSTVSGGTNAGTSWTTAAGAAAAGDTILDVARLCSKFGERVERLHLGSVDFGTGSSAGGEAGGLLCILCACPNLTHLSLAGAVAADGPFCGLDALEKLPAGFSLPRLRHLDLSDLLVPLPALGRLLGACAASLERLFLRGTRVCQGGKVPGPLDPRKFHPGPLLKALDGLDSPRLEGLDVSFAGVDFIELRSLLARLPALRDLYAVQPGYHAGSDDFKRLAEEARRPGRLVIGRSLLNMDAESLGKLRGHFDGTAYPRPEGSRLDVPRFVVLAFFKALCLGRSWIGQARRLVSELGVSPLARLDEASISISTGPWVPPYFRTDPSLLREIPELREGPTALHLLINIGRAPLRKLIAEWGLAPLVNVPLRAGSCRTPLHLAAKGGDHDSVEALLEAGADPLRQDAAGATALHVACQLGRVEAAKALLEAAARAGLDLLPVVDGAGRTPLQLLLDGFKSTQHERSHIAAHAVELLKLDGPTLEALGVRRALLEEPRWGEGGTEFLLHFAARECTPAAVRALLDAGADILLEDAGGSTVLRRAIAARDRAVEEALLDFARERGVPLDRLGAYPSTLSDGDPRPDKRARTGAPDAS
eukprot:tig00000042_g15626.t1